MSDLPDYREPQVGFAQFVPGTEWRITPRGVWIDGPHAGKCAIDHGTIVTGFCGNCGKIDRARGQEGGTP